MSQPRLRVRILRLTTFGLSMLLIAFLAIVVYISKQQAHGIITNPYGLRALPASSPAAYAMEFENVTLTASDGLKIAAWYIASQNRASVILVHGYKGDRDEMLNEAAMLHKHGYGAILIDLRGHGHSEGEQLTFGYYEVRDLEAAYQYLLTRADVDPQRIGIIGNSMGANISILYAAQNSQIKAVVSNSSFASLQDEVAIGVRQITGLPPFPFAPIMQFFAEQETGLRASQINAEAVVGSISPRPILIMHGGRDDLVPPNNGQRLYAAAREPKELWFDPDLGHCQFDTERPEEYERKVIALFDHHLLGE